MASKKRKFENRPSMTIEDHVKCGEDIYKIAKLHVLLVSDFHKKKCKRCKSLVGKTYKARSKADDFFYKYKLFYGKSELSPFDSFPAGFQSDMENLMYDDYCGHEECTPSMYYNVNERVRYAQLQKDFEPLSDERTLTEGDKTIIQAYNDKYYALMTYCMEHLKGKFDNKRKIQWMDNMKRCIDKALLITELGSQAQVQGGHGSVEKGEDW